MMHGNSFGAVELKFRDAGSSIPIRRMEAELAGNGWRKISQDSVAGGHAGFPVAGVACYRDVLLGRGQIAAEPAAEPNESMAGIVKIWDDFMMGMLWAPSG